jgi:aspartyl-tRNA(Asn)/glutamyl-tRNA(Gln) amidotransferase subunit A
LRVTLQGAGVAWRAGQIRAIDLVEQSLAAIDRDQPRTNAFIRVDADRARGDAVRADGERARGVDRGALHGLPISLKDLIDVAGEVTTAASRVLADRTATADAVVVTRLREAGAILIGKTNLHEFALGTTSEDSAFGAVHHPRDPDRSAGGSSGGSAVAVACGMGLASVGTDTGGSIRIPAAACGVVGLKPSVGDVPTDGVIPLSTSLDHVGPLTTTVADAAILWSVLAARPVPDLARATKRPLSLVRLRGYFDDPVAPDVQSAFTDALGALTGAGASIRDAELRPPPASRKPTSTSCYPRARPGTASIWIRELTTTPPSCARALKAGDRSRPWRTSMASPFAALYGARCRAFSRTPTHWCCRPCR